MQKIEESTIQFLKDLKENNDRDWFNKNKSRYEKARANFMAFVDALIVEIATFDPSIGHHTAKNTVFRIHRDVRFSNDKSPYKTNFGAHITSAQKKSEMHTRAGYYIHLEPGECMLAGGAHQPEKEWLRAIREEIDYNSKGLKEIINDPSFKKYFRGIEGEKLKTAPRDYPKDHPEIELLKHKSLVAVHPCSDNEVLKDDFLKHAASVFKALYPFDLYLNNTLVVT